MTEAAIIKTAEWKRMAKVANSEGVDCWQEINGRRYGVSPAGRGNLSENDIDLADNQPANGWAAWRDRHESKASGNSSRRKEAR